MLDVGAAAAAGGSVTPQQADLKDVIGYDGGGVVDEAVGRPRDAANGNHVDGLGKGQLARHADDLEPVGQLVDGNQGHKAAGLLDDHAGRQPARRAGADNIVGSTGWHCRGGGGVERG